MKQRTSLLGLLMLVVLSVNAQDSSSFHWSGYADVYYNYDFNKPVNHTRPGFVYSQNRTQEFALNLAAIKLNYAQEGIRANLALGTGTYMNANYAAEPGLLKQVLEANIGFALDRKKQWWLDAGILPSHIGFESAYSKDCPTYTRSVQADNSPYFETGARLSYSSVDGKWYAALLAVNGWQRIVQVDGNNGVSFGHQLTYKPNSKWTINSSSFVGNDKPQQTRKTRIFHDLYASYTANQYWTFYGGFDIGWEQKQKGSSAYNRWSNGVFIAKYQIDSQNAIAGRLEYFTDKNRILSSEAAPVELWGWSVNYDRTIWKRLLWRTEIRNLTNKEALFVNDNQLVKNSLQLISGMSINF